MSKDALEPLSREELIALLRQRRQENETRTAEADDSRLDRKREQLEDRLAQVLQQLYGQRRERFIDPDQLTLFTLEDIEALAAEDRQAELQRQQEELLLRRRGKKRPGHDRRPLPDHLPREVIRHELTAEEKACPCCGEERAEIGHESSEQLEYIPNSFKVLVHERVKYACRTCQEHVAIAEVPHKPIEKACPGRGCWPRRCSRSTATTCRFTGKRMLSREAESSCGGARSATGSPRRPFCWNRCIGG